MDRRDFIGGVVGAALAGGSFGASAGEAPGVAFQLSVMLWTVFRDLKFEQRLEKVVEAGYRNVELVDEYRNWGDDDIRRVNAKRKELGITFDCAAGLSGGIANPDRREAFLASLRRALPILERIGCPAVIVLSGGVVPGMSREAQRRSCVESLKSAADLIEGKNMSLFLENIDPEEDPKYFLTSSREGFEVVKAVNHPRVKFCYDLFHQQIAEGNLIRTLEQNADAVGLIHVADVPGRHEPGTGEINYQNVFRALARLKYDRVVAMEFFPSRDGVQTLRAARALALESGRQS